ncbi:hypothetical protein F5B21DRAFT_520099 [Xylaria acuta]|nr:hypothetical protein F5B21DRAFT_520099 [Xylaria acuta]
MVYYASSDLGADNATGRRTACTCHTCGTGSLSIDRFLQDSHSGQFYAPPTDTSTGTTSNSNSTNGNQSKSIDKNFVDRPGSSHENILTPSVVRPMSLPELSHLTAHAHMALPPFLYMPPYEFKHNAHLPYNISLLRTSVEAATRKQIGQLISGVSGNYLGDPYLPANQSANIPDELNTSVWITNLPPNVDHKTLLDHVRNCGKVYAAVINGPERAHIAAASKIVFFDVAGAQNLLKQARDGKFVVGGYIPRVILNRIKTAAKPPSPNSRVLHIEGPSCIVNQPYLTALFRSDGITWQDEEVIVLSNNGTLTRLEWRFGSYRCQAESARHLIDRVKRWNFMPPIEAQMWQLVTVHFGVDPCAPKPVVPQISTIQGPKSPTTNHANWRDPIGPSTLAFRSRTFCRTRPATQTPLNSPTLARFQAQIPEAPLDNSRHNV